MSPLPSTVLIPPMLSKCSTAPHEYTIAPSITPLICNLRHNPESKPQMSRKQTSPLSLPPTSIPSNQTEENLHSQIFDSTHTQHPTTQPRTRSLRDIPFHNPPLLNNAQSPMLFDEHEDGDENALNVSIYNFSEARLIYRAIYL
ncbi:hypothetical protein BJY04DRAFT_223299 [Aspergillus karnatakaensis]|uniref:uncharacterized protein n=1 Tax=Aspergillus karnatakaensis TaxID=1810916 RepID=UPI003CCCD7BB